MFTRAVEAESHRLLPGNTRAPPDDDRRGVSEPLRLLNEISATCSFSSLMEGWTWPAIEVLLLMLVKVHC